MGGGGAGAPGAFCRAGGGMSRRPQGRAGGPPAWALGLFLPWSRGGGLDLLDRPCQAHRLSCCSGSVSSCESGSRAVQFRIQGGSWGVHWPAYSPTCKCTRPRTHTHAHTRAHVCTCTTALHGGAGVLLCSAFLTVLFSSP